MDTALTVKPNNSVKSGNTSNLDPEEAEEESSENEKVIKVITPIEPDEESEIEGYTPKPKKMKVKSPTVGCTNKTFAKILKTAKKEYF